MKIRARTYKDSNRDKSRKSERVFDRHIQIEIETETETERLTNIDRDRDNVEQTTKDRNRHGSDPSRPTRPWRKKRIERLLAKVYGK